MHSDAQFEGSQGFLALHRDRMHNTYAGPVFFYGRSALQKCYWKWKSQYGAMSHVKQGHRY